MTRVNKDLIDAAFDEIKPTLRQLNIIELEILAARIMDKKADLARSKFWGIKTWSGIKILELLFM